MKRNFKRIIAFLISLMMLTTMIPTSLAARPSDFVDFPTGWSKAAVTAAVDNGLLVGFENDEIRPEDNLTRAEMATIITRAFGATTMADISAYRDVPQSEWYHSYIAKAVKMGAMQGKSSSRMAPDDNITREEVFTVLARVLVLSSENHRALNRFPDSGDISDWALDYIAALSERGYVNGDHNSYVNPQDNITREEFAQVMHNAIKRYITSPGTYTSNMNGIVVLRVGNVTLKNLSVTSDLVVGDGAGKDNVIIENLKVEKRFLARGGTMKFKNTTLGENVVVNNVNGVTHFNNYEDEPIFKNILENTEATFLTRGGGGGGGGTPPTPPTSYTVTFVVNGVSTPVTVPINPSGNTYLGTSNMPADPNVSGYNFGGWTYNGQPFDPEATVLTRDITVIATMTPIVYDLKYVYETNTAKEVEFKTETGYVKPVKFAKNDQKILPPASVINNPGYQFVGWIYDGKKIESTAQIETLPPTNAQAIEIKARFEEIIYKIEYARVPGINYSFVAGYIEPKEFKISNVTDTLVGKGLPAEGNIEVTGHRFAGWKYNNIGITNVNQIEKEDLPTNIVMENNKPTVKVVFTPVFVPENVYNVFYKSSISGSEVSFNTTVIKEFTESNKPDLPDAGDINIPEGYTFGGWKFNGTSIDEFDDIVLPLTPGTIVVDAIFNLKNYTINFKDQNGNPLTFTGSSHSGNYNVTNLPDLSDVADDIVLGEGYKFSGWTYDNNPITNIKNDLDLNTVPSTLEIKANIEPIEYQINFVDNVGNPLEFIATNHSDTYTVENMPVLSTIGSEIKLKEGYQFNNKWYYGTTEIDNIVDDLDLTTTGTTLTIKADISAIDYTVEFKNKDTLAQLTFGGIDKDGTHTVNNMPSLEALEDELDIPRGYEFKGWYYGTEEIDNIVEDIDLPSSATTLVITADIQPITYTLSFIDEQGRPLTVKPGEVLTSTYKVTDTLDLGAEKDKVAPPTGSYLATWMVNGNGITSMDQVTLPTTAGTITIVAKFLPLDTYHVAYKSSIDGTDVLFVTPVVKDFREDNKPSLPESSNVKIPEGYTFGGWKWNGTVITDFNQIVLPSSASTPIEVIAEFNAIDYTVNFTDLNDNPLSFIGGNLSGTYTVETMPQLSVVESKLSLNEGYQFNDKWYFDGNEIIDIIADLDLTATGTTLTIKADITATEYTVNFVDEIGKPLVFKNGAAYSGVYTVETMPDLAVVSNAINLEEGYEFSKWYYGPTEIDDIVDDLDLTTTGTTIMIKAETELIEYTVSFVDALNNPLTFKATNYSGIYTVKNMPDLAVVANEINLNEGYKFNRWYYGTTPVTDIVGDLDLTITGTDIKITADISAIEYNVSFKNYFNGQPVTFNGVNKNGVYTVVTMPELALLKNQIDLERGYEFKGWYYIDTEINDIIADIELTDANTTIEILVNIAPITYTLTFEDENGDPLNVTATGTLPSTYKVTDNLDLNALKNSVTPPTGHYLAAWIVNGNEITSMEQVTLPATAGNITIVAKFLELDKYHVSYKSSIDNTDVIFNTTIIKDFTADNKPSLPLATQIVIPKGYEFGGWKWNGNTITDFNQIVLPSSASTPIVVTAVFNPINYTVNFVDLSNNPLSFKGTNYNGIYTVTTMPTLSVVANEINLGEGYKFNGKWYYGSTEIIKISDILDITDATTITVRADISMIEYQVVFQDKDNNSQLTFGGYSKDGTYTVATMPSLAELKNIIDLQEGYEIKGWYYGTTEITDIVGSLDLTATGEYLVITADIQLIEYQITFTDLDGNQLVFINNEYSGTYNIHNIPSLAVIGNYIKLAKGYQFNNKWYYGSNEIIDIVADLDLSQTGKTLTIKADISAAEYGLQFINKNGAHESLTFNGLSKDAVHTIHNMPSLTVLKNELDLPRGHEFKGWYHNGTLIDDIAVDVDLPNTGATIEIEADIVPITYTLTFEDENGDPLNVTATGTLPSTYKVTDTLDLGAEKAKVTPPTGYYLAAWIVNGNEITSMDQVTLPTTAGTITIVAKFLPLDTYHVVYKSNIDGTEVQFYTPVIKDFTIDNKPSLPESSNVKVPEGYTFGGWKWNGTVITDFNQIVLPSSASTPIEVTARFDLKLYTVKFVDNNDNPLPFIGIDYSKNYTVDDMPDLRVISDYIALNEGYKFNGWSYNGTPITNIVNDLDLNNVPATLTIKADIQAINYTVKFVNKDTQATLTFGGASKNGTYTVLTMPSLADLKDTLDLQTGFEFKGWYYGNTLITDIISGIDLPSEAAEIVISAKIERIAYNVKFVDSSNNPLAFTGENYSKSYTIYDMPDLSAVKNEIVLPNGHLFKKWTYNGNDITAMSQIPFDTLTSNEIIIKAEYELVTYNLNYASNIAGVTLQWRDGYIAPTSFTVTDYDPLPLKTDVKAVDGYRFEGWLYNGQPISSLADIFSSLPSASLGMNPTVTLKANFVEKDKYSVKYVIEGTTNLLEFIDPSQVVTSFKGNNKPELPALNNLKLDNGYKFVEWVYDGSVISSFVDITLPAEPTEITVYARLKAIEYNLTYASEDSSLTLEFESGYAAPDKFTVTTAPLLSDISEKINAPLGYEFDAWVYNGAVITKLTDITLPATEGEIINIKARFKLITYTIKYVNEADEDITFYNNGTVVRIFTVADSILLPESSNVKALNGYKHISWWYNGVEITNVSEIRANLPETAAEITVTGKFDVITYPLTFVEYPTNVPATFEIGYTVPDKFTVLSVPSLSEIAENIVAPYGYKFKQWRYNGNVITTLMMDNLPKTETEIKVAAEFEPITYIVKYVYEDKVVEIPFKPSAEPDVTRMFTVEEIEAGEVDLPGADAVEAPNGKRFIGWVYEGSTVIGGSTFSLRANEPGISTYAETNTDTPSAGTATGGGGGGTSSGTGSSSPKEDFLGGFDEITDLPPVEAVVTLSARFESITYDIRYVDYETGNDIEFNSSYTAPDTFTVEDVDLLSDVATKIKTANGYFFKDWYYGNDVITSVEDIDLPETAALITVRAKFDMITYKLALASENSSLALTINPSYVKPDEFKVTDDYALPSANEITAPKGYKFDKWIYNGVEIDSTGDITELPKQNGATVKVLARFIPIEYPIVFKVYGTTDDAQFDDGFTVPTTFTVEDTTLLDTLKANIKEPDEESAFESWIYNGAVITSIADIEIPADETTVTTLYVKFKEAQLYKVSFFRGYNPTGTPRKELTVKSGETVPKTDLDEIVKKEKETVEFATTSYAPGYLGDDYSNVKIKEYWYQDDSGKFVKFDENVAITKDTDVFMMFKRFGTFITAEQTDLNVQMTASYNDETRFITTLEEVLISGGSQLDLALSLNQVPNYEEIRNQLLEKLISVGLIDNADDMNIKKLAINIPISTLIKESTAHNMIKDYVREAVKGTVDIESVSDVIIELGIRGLVTDQQILDYIATLTEDEKIAFADEVYYESKATSHYIKFMDDLMNEDMSEIKAEDVIIVKKICDTIRNLSLDDVLAETDNSAIDKVIEIMGKDFLNGHFITMKTEYCDGLDEALTRVSNTGVTEEYTTALILRLDLINDVLKVMYDKAQPIVKEKVESLSGGTYDNNIHLQYLVEHDIIGALVDGDSSYATKEMTGYSVKDLMDYYYYMLSTFIIMDEALTWYGDDSNISDDELDAIYTSAFGKLEYAHGKLNEILTDFVEDGTLPSKLQDIVSQISQLNDMVVKYQDKAKSLFEKYLNSSINEIIGNLDENEKVEKVVEILIGKEDPVFTIDSLYNIFYNYDDNMQAKLKELIDSGKLRAAIDKFEATEFGKLFKGNGTLGGVGDKIDEIKNNGKIETAFESVYDLLVIVADYGIEYFRTDENDITVIDAYEVTVGGITLKLSRYYK